MKRRNFEDLLWRSRALPIVILSPFFFFLEKKKERGRRKTISPPSRGFERARTAKFERDQRRSLPSGFWQRNERLQTRFSLATKGSGRRLRRWLPVEGKVEGSQPGFRRGREILLHSLFR